MIIRFSLIFFAFIFWSYIRGPIYAGEQLRPDKDPAHCIAFGGVWSESLDKCFQRQEFQMAAIEVDGEFDSIQWCHARGGRWVKKRRGYHSCRDSKNNQGLIRYKLDINYSLIELDENTSICVAEKGSYGHLPINGIQVNTLYNIKNSLEKFLLNQDGNLTRKATIKLLKMNGFAFLSHSLAEDLKFETFMSHTDEKSSDIIRKYLEKVNKKLERVNNDSLYIFSIHEMSLHKLYQSKTFSEEVEQTLCQSKNAYYDEADAVRHMALAAFHSYQEGIAPSREFLATRENHEVNHPGNRMDLENNERGFKIAQEVLESMDMRFSAKRTLEEARRSNNTRTRSRAKGGAQSIEDYREENIELAKRLIIRKIKERLNNKDISVYKSGKTKCRI